MTSEFRLMATKSPEDRKRETLRQIFLKFYC